ncbi:hypothetical protein [Polyangium mundeleinium]|uniref:Uncharacterized protein n=1 Tax=Polyangium mundeleinium TaxID=2995306 RepID=A0ABT5EDG2_9BACT|nr:hypothetical protein [Polyangium mundeleinium]MDC0739862.1 hypothetical protein [Polyangium mundeleinium]
MDAGEVSGFRRSCTQEGARARPRADRDNDARAERPRVRFSFVCPARWETLAPTEDPSVRFCGQCQERVYFCESSRVAAVHARAGDCIAVPRELSDTDLHLSKRGVLGRPDPLGNWARDLFPDDE